MLAKLLANNVDLEAQFNISQWPMLGKAHMQSSGFGGFIGYNFQFSEAVIGVGSNCTTAISSKNRSGGNQCRMFQYPVDYVVRYRILARPR